MFRIIYKSSDVDDRSRPNAAAIIFFLSSNNRTTDLGSILTHNKVLSVHIFQNKILIYLILIYFKIVFLIKMLFMYND